MDAEILGRWMGPEILPVRQLSFVAVQVPVQFPWSARFRAGLGVEVHDGDDPGVRFAGEQPRVMWIAAGVEEDELPRVRPDHRAVPVDFGHALRGDVM